MGEQIDVIIIGGGQAGLSVSYFLTQHRKKHFVLERGRVGETWRSKRWDSFCLDLPNWGILLPGFPYSGDQPDGFMSRDGIVAYLEHYADCFNLPILKGVNVESVEPSPEGHSYLIRTMDAVFEAKHVVVATGGFQVPKLPSVNTHLPADFLQLTPDTYKNPESLPPGAVLLVGSGSSGGQIAEELIEAGREVYLSTSRCAWTPRRYRGKDTVYWFIKMGRSDEIVDKPGGDHIDFSKEADSKFACTPMISGKNGGHDLNLRLLARKGVILLGRLQSIRGYEITLAPNLEQNIREGDETTSNTLKLIDQFIEENQIDAPELTPEESSWKHPVIEPRIQQERRTVLNLQSANISTLIWTTGYRVDYSWVHVPVFDDKGYPVHRRGVTSVQSLYFIGLPWLYKRNSAGLGGVGQDAEYIASVIANASS